MSVLDWAQIVCSVIMGGALLTYVVVMISGEKKRPLPNALSCHWCGCNLIVRRAGYAVSECENCHAHGPDPRRIIGLGEGKGNEEADRLATAAWNRRTEGGKE